VDQCGEIAFLQLSAKITKSQIQFMHELPPPSYSSRKLVADLGTFPRIGGITTVQV